MSDDIEADRVFFGQDDDIGWKPMKVTGNYDFCAAWANVGCPPAVQDTPDASGYDYNRYGLVTEALADKGYHWATARQMAMRLVDRIPDGLAPAAATWITSNVPDIWKERGL